MEQLQKEVDALFSNNNTDKAHLYINVFKEGVICQQSQRVCDPFSICG